MLEDLLKHLPSEASDEVRTALEIFARLGIFETMGNAILMAAGSQVVGIDDDVNLARSVRANLAHYNLLQQLHNESKALQKPTNDDSETQEQ